MDTKGVSIFVLHVTMIDLLKHDRMLFKELDKKIHVLLKKEWKKIVSIEQLYCIKHRLLYMYRHYASITIDQSKQHSKTHNIFTFTKSW